jgi:thymidylate synthase (FAD)
MVEMTDKIDVLDKGYVRLVDKMGDDLSIANAARVSYDRESHEMSEKDARLINFLWREKHTSPFRHAVLSFEVYAPLMVARQWWKHHVAATGVDDQNAWNESSRRYITEDAEFYVPAKNEWRSKPENSKQGSGAVIDSELGMQLTDELESLVWKSTELYEEAMALGVAAEQARLFLPAYGMYVRWRWTTSLHGVLNFLNLRLPHDSQKEIQDYAKAIAQVVEREFPYTYGVISNVDSGTPAS